ncbi:type II secretion system minor pseudopilin GspK [Colwellia sp. RE-S-Sl-9]
MKKISCHRGVALITVMLVVALAAILATQMTAKLQLQLQRSANIEANQQAYWLAMGAEAFAKRVLIMSFDGDESVTHLGQLWAQGENTYPVEYGEITGEITDLQSCFNLNALRITDSVATSPSPTNVSSGKNLPAEALERLILAIGIENVSSFEAKDMVSALTDWVDENGIVTNSGGAEDSEYSSKEYPYLSANNFLGSFNELRVVEHFTLEAIEELKPYVCVIPNSNLHKINVNTINADHSEILSALFDISSSEAEEIISGRGDEGYKKVDDVFLLPQIAKHKLTQEQKDQLVVDSEYFKLKTKTTFNDSYFFLNSIMKVEKNNQINIISRTIGRD